MLYNKDEILISQEENMKKIEYVKNGTVGEIAVDEAKGIYENVNFRCAV